MGVVGGAGGAGGVGGVGSGGVAPGSGSMFGGKSLANFTLVESLRDSNRLISSWTLLGGMKYLKSSFDNFSNNRTVLRLLDRDMAT